MLDRGPGTDQGRTTETSATVFPPTGNRATESDTADSGPRPKEPLTASDEPRAAGPAPQDRGVVTYGGDVTLHGRVVWNIGLSAGAVLDLPNAPGAAVLAGLGHPTRTALIRRLLAGPASTAELQQVVEGASTGQLYHHLRTLTGCGLAEQDGRGRYRVPPPAVVPALALLLAAADVSGDLR